MRADPPALFASVRSRARRVRTVLFVGRPIESKVCRSVRICSQCSQTFGGGWAKTFSDSPTKPACDLRAQRRAIGVGGIRPRGVLGAEVASLDSPHRRPGEVSKLKAVPIRAGPSERGAVGVIRTPIASQWPDGRKVDGSVVGACKVDVPASWLRGSTLCRCWPSRAADDGELIRPALATLSVWALRGGKKERAPPLPSRGHSDERKS